MSVYECDLLDALKYRELMRNEIYDKVPIEFLLNELSKLEEKRDRLNRLVNEDLDRTISKINYIEKYIKNKNKNI